MTVRSASVAIVGGGVIGASVAYHLACRGWTDVVVLEREPDVGRGSTSRATGGFRAQYGTAVNVRLSLLARERLRAFHDETGGDPGYDPCGYLWLAADEDELAQLREGQRVQHAEGLREATMVDARGALELNPALAPDGIAGAAFCPTDGYIRPSGIMQGYLAAARRMGVRVECGVTVAGLERRPDGSISTLLTSAGPVSVGAVVNAAGAWAQDVARLAGVELPVEPLRRQVATTGPCDLLPARMPMTLFCRDGFHLRVRDGRVLLLKPTPGAPGRPFACDVEQAWIDDVTALAHARVPVLRQAAIDRGAAWAGLYEMSPDKHAILGAAPRCPNLFLINGSSGHGVMHAPALGLLLAEIMSDGVATSLDVRPLRPERFAEGDLNPSSGLL
jgi:sarcosine oxidase subunit beta